MPTVPTVHDLPMAADIADRAIFQCASDYALTSDMTPKVIDVVIGQGRHSHDASCSGNGMFRKCITHLGDSDYVITLQYAKCGWETMYGVTVLADGTAEFVIWQD